MDVFSRAPAGGPAPDGWVDRRSLRDRRSRSRRRPSDKQWWHLRSNGIAMFATAPIWVALLLLGYWYFIDYEPWNFYGGVPMEIHSDVLTPFVPRGHKVKVEYEWEVFRDCQRMVELWLMNGTPKIIRQHQGSTTGTGPGKHGPIIVEVKVPEDYDTGPASLRSIAEFDCNPLKSWRIVEESRFTVIQ